jgi:hypothetical protein
MPTHQVNALIMDPAGNRVRDLLRAVGVMSALFADRKIKGEEG